MFLEDSSVGTINSAAGTRERRRKNKRDSERVFRSFAVPTLGRLSTFYLEPNRSGPNNQIVVFFNTE